MKIIQSRKYIRDAAKLLHGNPQLSKRLLAVYKMMEENIFDNQLKTHKLKDDFEGRWSCSLTFRLRIIFRFSKSRNEKTIELLTIGSHDEVY